MAQSDHLIMRDVRDPACRKIKRFPSGDDPPVWRSHVGAQCGSHGINPSF